MIRTLSVKLSQNGEAAQKTPQRDALLPVGLVQGSKKIRLFFGRELHNRFVASSKDGNGRSLRQREAFNDDFSVNYDA